MAETVNLPASSITELEKIIKAYGHIGKEADLDTLSKLTGIGRTTISPNNPFLVDTNIITSGKKKKITAIGEKLARALDHKHNDDTRECWAEIIAAHEYLSNLVSTVRIKGSLTEEEAANHALYASGQKNIKANRTGARAVIDILLASGLVLSEGDVLTVSKNQSPASSGGEPENSHPPAVEMSGTMPVEPETQAAAQVSPIPMSVPNTNSMLPISINIELHLPATSNPEIYRELFKALRENLLTGPEDA